MMYVVQSGEFEETLADRRKAVSLAEKVFGRTRQRTRVTRNDGTIIYALYPNMNPISEAATKGLSMRGAVAADRAVSLGWKATWRNNHLFLDVPGEWENIGGAYHSQRTQKRRRAIIAGMFGRSLVHALERSDFQMRSFGLGYIWAPPLGNPKRKTMKKRRKNPELFQRYDILQVKRKGQWLDFSTLRDASDFAHARRIMANGWEEFDGSRLPGESFRVVRGGTGEVLATGSVRRNPRRRRNPSNVTIHLHGPLIDALSAWHGGQWSAVYSLSSTGKGTPEKIEEAISELSAIKRSGKASQTGLPYHYSARDWKFLKATIAELRWVLHNYDK